jgi:hypothetical protein
VRTLEEDEAFAALVDEHVRRQVPLAIITEPHPRYFTWRAGGRLAHMLCGAETASVSFVESPEIIAPPQTFPIDVREAPAIAASVAQWLRRIT